MTQYDWPSLDHMSSCGWGKEDAVLGLTVLLRTCQKFVPIVLPQWLRKMIIFLNEYENLKYPNLKNIL